MKRNLRFKSVRTAGFSFDGWHLHGARLGPKAAVGSAHESTRAFCSFPRRPGGAMGNNAPPQLPLLQKGLERAGHLVQCKYRIDRLLP